MRTTTTRRRHAETRGRRLAIRTLGIGLITAAACVDHDVSGPASIGPTPSTASLAVQQSPQTGIDCGCTRVGAYAAPAPGKTISTGRDGASPNNVYQLTATTIGSTINLRINRGATVVKEFSGLPSTTNWGFSPDDNRFVYHYLSGTANQMHNVFLYDLAASGVPLVKSFQTATGSSQIVFSPRGRHLLYAWRTAATSTSLTIVDAVTGATRYQTAFTFQIPPGSPGNTFGMASWGFSPDPSDRTFAYLYISGQTSSQWNVVNLALPISTALVHTESAATGFWRFSPAGDVIAAARQSTQTQVWVFLARTLDGSVVANSGRTLSVGTIAFRSSLADHIVSVGGVDQPPLAANTADAACQVPVPPTLSALSLSPTSVQGGGTSTGTVTLSAAAPAGGVVVTLSSSNTGRATVPPNVTVPSGSVSKTFTVQTSPVTASTSVTISAVAGGVTKTAALTVTAPPPPIRSLAISLPSLSFGNQAPGTTSGAQSVTVSNNGNVPLTMSGIAITGDFARNHNCPISPVMFAVGASCTIDVTFTPTTTGARSGTLSVTSDAANSPHSVALSGNGYAPVVTASVSSSSLTFGSVRLGLSPSRRWLTLTSTGTAPLTVSTVSIGGTHLWDFYVGTDNCGGVTLSPGSACTVELYFEPWALGTRTAALTITHNAQGGPSVVALSGLGLSPGPYQP